MRKVCQLDFKTHTKNGQQKLENKRVFSWYHRRIAFEMMNKKWVGKWPKNCLILLSKCFCFYFAGALGQIWARAATNTSNKYRMREMKVVTKSIVNLTVANLNNLPVHREDFARPIL